MPEHEKLQHELVELEYESSRGKVDHKPGGTFEYNKLTASDLTTNQAVDIWNFQAKIRFRQLDQLIRVLRRHCILQSDSRCGSFAGLNYECICARIFHLPGTYRDVAEL